MYSIGDRAEISKVFATSDVELFADLSGDKNPIHLNSDYAAKSIFTEKIVHGFLYASLVSAVIASKLPGPGSIYLGQELKFLKPVYHNQLITAEVVIVEIRPDRNIFILETNCFNDQGVLVLQGRATIKNDRLF